MIRSSRAGNRPAFTMIELLVVILIVAILVALLVPAIVASIRTVRNAQVSSDIQTLGTSINQFKVSFGEFPPSRIYLHEGGFYPVNDQTRLANMRGVGSDITLGQLAQRSLRYMQKFWPRVQWNTTTSNPQILPWAYDFNGTGVYETNHFGPEAPLQGGFIIQGHQCLTFFLGGIPYNPGAGAGIGMTGFGKNPTNPFTNSFPGNPLYRGANGPSSTPYYEFKANRLAFDPNDPNYQFPTTYATTPYGYGIPAYIDAIGSPSSVAGSPINFYAYFSSYGGNYDPNDINFAEVDQHSFPLGLNSAVGFPCFTAGGVFTNVCLSSPPNPYTASVALPTTGGTTVFQSPNTFQIISSGLDGNYGLGGQWSNQGGNTLPFEPNADNSADDAVRKPEIDNLSNFSAGKLGG